MRVEEIAVRQEVRQMLSEAGINRNTLREMTQEILREEIKKGIWRRDSVSVLIMRRGS